MVPSNRRRSSVHQEQSHESLYRCITPASEDEVLYDRNTDDGTYTGHTPRLLVPKSQAEY